jgi:hypothetical protein
MYVGTNFNLFRIGVILKFRPNGLIKSTPGANPTIVSYNASAVNFYHATSNIVRFE